MDEASDGRDGAPRTLADRVVVSYPEDLSERGRDRIGQEYYRTYLTRVHDDATPGDEWRESTDVGCCGSTMWIPLRVEAVEGGSGLGPETEVVYEERAESGAEGGWAVQNEIDADRGSDAREPRPEPGPEPEE